MEKKSIFAKIDELYTKATKVIIGDMPHDAQVHQNTSKQKKPSTQANNESGIKHTLSTVKEKILNLGKPADEKTLLYKEVVKREKEEAKAIAKREKEATKSKKTTSKKAPTKKSDHSAKTATKTTTSSKKAPLKKKTSTKATATTTTKKTVAKKPVTKTSTSKTTTTKKSPTKKETSSTKASTTKAKTVKKTTTTTKKSPTKKTATTKATPTATTKKTVVKKPVAKTSISKATTTKKSPTKKETSSTKASIKKAPTKKTATSKTTPTTTSKKTVTKKPVTRSSNAIKKVATKTAKPTGNKRVEKIALYAKDIKKHYGEVDEAFLTIIVKNLGPSIYKRDAETVACSDPKELDTVRKNFLMKKLQIDASQGVLDAAIQDVCEELKATRTKYRATFYYALAKKFKKESVLS